MNGALILDKPSGPTSHDIVARARRILAERRIGHTGTLDPFATGVLVLLVGFATRLARFYEGREKTYEGAIRFGYSTDSYDCTGVPSSADCHPTLYAAALRQLFAESLGEQWQQPPPVSAKKVDGARAYRLARKGLAPELKPVPVVIHELHLLNVEGSVASFRARVSSGTYIRALAHDLGVRLGTGAHLSQLRRTAVGEFTDSQAVSLDQLQGQARCGGVSLIPAAELLPEIPAHLLEGAAMTRALHGNPVPLSSSVEWVKLIDESGALRAIARHIGGSLYHPQIVCAGEPQK